MLNKINIDSSKQKIIICVVLAAVTLAVFWQVNQFDFVSIDDGLYITENSHIQSKITLDGINWAFTTKYTGIWNPLAWISFMLDYQLYGLNAGGYHVTNVILHILSTLLLFWVFNRMTGSIWKSAFVAALFALHPLHVESVVWISERKNVLSAFFWMLTLCFYVYYTEKTVIRRYLLVLLFFVCGLMSKPIVVTLPLVMILLDYWPLGRFDSQKGNVILWQLREKSLFLILSVTVAIITLYNPVKQLGTCTDFIPLQYRIQNAPISFVTYLAKIFWPHDLTILYPFSDNIPFWQVLSAVLLIIVISVFVILVLKRFPCFFVGWLWYAITILPVIGLIQIGNEAMADRYTYLPSIGIFIMLSWSIPILFEQEEIRKKILFTSGVLILTVLAVITWHQCGYWKNSTSLFDHALQVKKDNYLAHNNLGLALFKEGRTQEAIDQFNDTIRLKPDYGDAYLFKGIVYTALGRYQQAIENFTESIRLMPDCAECYFDRGFTYSKFGLHSLAIEDYNEAIRLIPNYVYAYYYRGNAYASLGLRQRATEDYNQAKRFGFNQNLQQ